MSDEYGFPYDPNMEKIVEDSNDASSYGYIPEIPRLFLRSHIFGGSHVREERKVYVYNCESKRFEKRPITTPKLQERLFLEILSNALDNSFKSQRMGYQFPPLEITMNSDTISIKSGGVPVPIDIHEYFYSQKPMQFGTVAELIFGVIGAGGNTNDKKSKQGGGQNGYGAKLTNVFSRYFEVEIGDNIRGFHQKIIWRKNMMEKVSSVITPSQFAFTTQPDQKGLFHIYPTGQDRYQGHNFVKVTWKQDFRKFGISYFSKDDMELYMKYSIEASFIGKFPIIFNGINLDYRSAQAYLSLYPREIIKNSLIHYEFFSQNNLSGKELDTAIANLQVVPSVELIILDTPNEGVHISYCNGINNFEGGSHTDTSYRELLGTVKDLITSSKSFTKDIDMSKVNIGDIKKHISIIINYKCNDPEFKGQDKEKLVKPAPKINITADEAGKMKKWAVVNGIYTILSGKHLKNLTSDSKGLKGRIKDDFNFRDANWFGTSRQNETVLILCEGNSAGSYISKWILATPEKRDKYAVMLLRGKFKNVTDLDFIQLMENEEIRKLIKFMGFEYGVDYTIQENLSKLRIGYIYIMVDADSDGQHIQSLLMNFIYRVFPSFLLARRLFYVPTPVIRILNGPNGGTKQIFYNMFDYKKYVESIGNSNHVAKFFKGLAAGKDTYAKEDSKVSPIVYANFDQLAGQTFDIAFKKGSLYTNERKKWIQACRDRIEIDVLYDMTQPASRFKYVNISDYINTKLVEYSLDTFARALPSYKDGLKKSQRQVLWYILMEWDFGKSRKGEVNIASIASSAKSEAKYHHGDLTETLARTASNFPGSNNVPLMTQEGQFGTREKLGADLGASRYVETKPEPIVSKIFDKELMNLVENNIVENKKVEPKWIPCKIPLHIINGVVGIATAYSIEIPCYHPVDVIMWIIRYITDEQCFPMIPWFRGFTGGIELEIFKNKYIKENDMHMYSQDMIKYYEGLTMSTYGIFQVMRERDQNFIEEKNGQKVNIIHRVSDLIITEIPIGLATAKYVHEIEKIVDKIDDKSQSTDNPILHVYGWPKPVNHKELKLVQRTGLCNITLIDDNSYPLQMRNVYEALKIYCDNMKDIYTLLKKIRLENLEKAIIDETKIIKLIELLIHPDEPIKTKKQKESFIEEQLLKYNIEFSYYKKLSRRSESEEGYNEHLNKLIDLQNKYKEISERHYLQEWHQQLIELIGIFNSDPSYNKLQHHQYPYVLTKVEDLISGKVKSPYVLKEEVIPVSI